MNKINNRKGLTLVETFVSMTVLIIIALLVLNSFSTKMVNEIKYSEYERDLHYSAINISKAIIDRNPEMQLTIQLDNYVPVYSNTESKSNYLFLMNNYDKDIKKVYHYGENFVIPYRYKHTGLFLSVNSSELGTANLTVRTDSPKNTKIEVEQVNHPLSDRAVTTEGMHFGFPKGYNTSNSTGLDAIAKVKDSEEMEVLEYEQSY